MQTAAIPYRVADFLKDHPPFQYLEEAELVALASHGRVKFHDVDEYICWQGAAHGPFVFVIQQGSVSLWDETQEPPKLVDMRGPGDLVGTERFNGSPTSLYSAKSSSEVVIYALNAEDFERAIARHPDAQSYVAAYSSLTTGHSSAVEQAAPHEVFVVDLLRDTAPLSCTPQTTIQEAAQQLVDSGAAALAITDGLTVSGIVTPNALLRWITTGARGPAQPARNIAPPLCVMPPEAHVSEVVILMAESRTDCAVITSDGTPQRPLQHVVTAATLAPVFGENPIELLQAVGTARTIPELRSLHLRARAWLLKSLTSAAAIDWLSDWAGSLNRAILTRLLTLTNVGRPDQLWCFYGAAGRSELLTAAAPKLAVIGSQPEPFERALADVGYLAPEPIAAATLDEWKDRFAGWIQDPLRNEVHLAYLYFDMQPVVGPGKAFHELKTHVHQLVQHEPVFLKLLANDCLSSLPPLTFYRDLVIEDSGQQSDQFHLQSSAVQPLSAVARVFGIAAGRPLDGSTISRFELARRHLPAQESIFREAAETMRLMLFHQARAGLRTNSNGYDLPLAMLSRHDRQMLKAGFRSIQRLLEFAAPCAWLEAV